MRRRGFNARKTISFLNYPKSLCNNWKPKKKDFTIIKKRIKEKIEKKPDFYTYTKKVEKN